MNRLAKAPNYDCEVVRPSLSLRRRPHRRRFVVWFAALCLVTVMGATPVGLDAEQPDQDDFYPELAAFARYLFNIILVDT